MATNLVSVVMQFLTPELIGRVAAALGLDRNQLQSAINAAVPGLLAGFSGVATQPGGPQKLVEAAKQETGTLGKFADMLGGGSQSTFIERGSQLLTSLLVLATKLHLSARLAICRARSRQERFAIRDARSHRYGHSRPTARRPGSGRERYHQSLC